MEYSRGVIFQEEDGRRDYKVTGVQACALPICATKCLGDEPEAAQPTAAPPAGATLAGEGDADQLAQRAEEAHVGLLRTGLAAFLWLRPRAPARRPRRPWRRLAPPLHEPHRA